MMKRIAKSKGDKVVCQAGRSARMLRGDRAEALDAYAPEVEWHTSGEFVDQRVYRGRAGLEGSGRSSRRTWRS